jgi:FkbM family methyltransferase
MSNLSGADDKSSFVQRLCRKYRTEGIRGLQKGILRRLAGSRQFSNPVPTVIDQICKGNDFNVVQLGAHVGDTPNDPLFRTFSNRLKNAGGRLICVEPVKAHFEKLVENYRGVPNVFFENVAISDHAGCATFYRLAVDPVEYGFPDWLSQLGSLKDERMRSLWDRYEADQQIKEFYLQHRIEERVDCITFTELLHRHNLSRIDFLQIDVEGYELEILRTIDFNRIFIRFVNYERFLLHEHKQEADFLMRKNGFTLVDHGQDTFCYRNWWSYIKWNMHRMMSHLRNT